jgi:hypothetical protein
MPGRPARPELLQGTLDLLILRTLLPGRSHGHAIARHIHRTSEDLLQVESGSLYPALHRLEAKGWIYACWDPVPAALFGTKLLKAFLYETQPNDPISLTLATASLVVAATLAGYLPARKASRIDPMVALRHE